MPLLHSHFTDEETKTFKYLVQGNRTAQLMNDKPKTQIPNAVWLCSHDPCNYTPFHSHQLSLKRLIEVSQPVQAVSQGSGFVLCEPQHGEGGLCPLGGGSFF